MENNTSIILYRKRKEMLERQKNPLFKTFYEKRNVTHCEICGHKLYRETDIDIYHNPCWDLMLKDDDMDDDEYEIVKLAEPYIHILKETKNKESSIIKFILVDYNKRFDEIALKYMY